MSEDEERTLYTEESEPIKWLVQRYTNHLDRCTLVFGASGSGKTTLIEEILYLCKEFIPNYIVVCPENSRKFYSSKLPDICIKEDLTKEMLDSIWKRQIHLTRVVNMANDCNNLQLLFNRANDAKARADIEAVTLTARQFIGAIERDKTKDFSERRTNIESIRSMCEDRIKKIYKDTISRNTSYLKRLEENKQLNETEIITLNFYNVNPRLCLIIDDRTECFEKWMKFYKKDESNVFHSIFFTGRHNYMTIIISAHDDKAIRPELRKNARVIYYTTSQALITSLERGANAFSKDQKKFGQRAASIIFADTDNPNPKVQNYKKMCYIRDDPAIFRYLICNRYGEFRLGAESLYQLCQKIPSRENPIDENPFVAGLIGSKKKKKAPVHSTIVSRSRKY